MLKALSPIPSAYSPTFGTSGVSGYITPPSLPKPLAVLGGAASILGSALLINDVIGKLGGYEWRDNQLAKIGGGNISRSGGASNPLGGQAVGVEYLIQVQVTFSDGETRYHVVTNGIGNFSTLQPDAYMLSSGIPFTGSIGSVGLNRYQFNGAYITVNGQNTPSFVASLNIASSVPVSVSIAKIIRRDGQPNTNADTDSKLPPVPYGYTPPTSPFKTDEDRKVGTPKPLQASRANGLLGAVGLGGAVPTRSLSPSPVRPSNPNPNPNPSVSPPFAPSPNKHPLPSPAPEKEPKKIPPPINPSDNKPPDLRQELTRLGAILALILGATAFDNLKNAAKTGSCESLKSPSCTKDMEDRIKNPVNEKIDSTKAALGADLAAQATSLGLVLDKLNAAKEFSEKVARAARLDKVYNLLTFITVIHNAQMLSGSLATTLMETLSLGLATVGIKDENESPIDIQSIINSTVEDKVKGIIGVENYTVLSDRWKKAVRVYQSAANITYQVRSLWDSAKSLAELTGANVGKIGNALRRDGVVSENAYGAMADNPLMVNSAMTRLQNLDEAASHLNSITSEAYGVTETVTQIKKDQDDFKKLVKEGTSSTTPIVNDQQKAIDDAAKLASVSPAIATTDLAKPD